MLWRFIITMTSIFSCFVGYSQSQTTNIDTLPQDISNLSFSDISLYSTFITNKKETPITEAPGMVTVYRKKDIERYGYYTLKDLSNITSGYSSFSTFGETNLETRGQKAGSWNVSKHLLLIDGIPVNHTRANSAPLDYQIPLFFADRVEFLKGPGSALYGTSAFYGVMSITSQNLKENGTLAESRLSYGDAGQTKRLMGNAIIKSDLGQTNLSLSHFKKGFSGDSIGINNNHFHYNNYNATFLNSSFKLTDTKLKGLSIGAIYMFKNSHSGEHWIWGGSPSPNNQETWTELIPYLKYDIKINSQLQLNSYIKYNSSTQTGLFAATWNNIWIRYDDMINGDSSNTDVITSSAFSYTTNDIEGFLEATYDLNEHTSIIAGLNAFTRKQVATPDSYEWNVSIPLDTNGNISHSFNHLKYDGSVAVNVTSGFLQVQQKINFLNGLMITGGGRFDIGFSDAGTYSQFSPRLGLVLKTIENLNLKLLYGQALRTPGIREIQGNAAIIEDVKINGGDPSGIPDVGAEIIKSLELGANYNQKNVNLSITSFYNITTNPLDGIQYKYITAQGEESSPNIFVNTDGNITATGLEIDINFSINNYLHIMTNHAYAQAFLNDSISFIDVPRQKTNFAATVLIPFLNQKHNISITTVFKRVWGYTVTKGLYNNRDFINGYNMVDLNVQIPVNDIIGIELQIRNVLDTQWKQPSLLGPNYMIPLPRRNTLITLYTKF